MRKCIICQQIGEQHHFIRRNNLRKCEVKDERFQITLCREHHHEVHFSTKTSGLDFYEKYHLVDLICEKCGFDVRLLRWIESQKYKRIKQ